MMSKVKLNQVMLYTKIVPTTQKTVRSWRRTSVSRSRDERTRKRGYFLSILPEPVQYWLWASWAPPFILGSRAAEQGRMRTRKSVALVLAESTGPKRWRPMLRCVSTHDSTCLPPLLLLEWLMLRHFVYKLVHIIVWIKYYII